MKNKIHRGVKVVVTMPPMPTSRKAAFWARRGEAVAEAALQHIVAGVAGRTLHLYRELVEPAAPGIADALAERFGGRVFTATEVAEDPPEALRQLHAAARLYGTAPKTWAKVLGWIALVEPRLARVDTVTSKRSRWAVRDRW
jgi:hypothetical protein